MNEESENKHKLVLVNESAEIEMGQEFGVAVEEIEQATEKLGSMIIYTEKTRGDRFSILGEDGRLKEAINQKGKKLDLSAGGYKTTEFTKVFEALNDLLIKAKKAQDVFGNVKKFDVSHIADELIRIVTTETGTDFRSNFVLGYVVNEMKESWSMERDDVEQIAVQKKKEIAEAKKKKEEEEEKKLQEVVSAPTEIMKGTIDEDDDKGYEKAA